MKLGRNLTVKIRFILDELVPPILRDQYWFMALPVKFVFGKKADIFLHFKERAKFMTDKQFSKVYEEIEPYIIQRGTDLNTQCMNKIPQDIKGRSVLEVGSGRGLLAIKLSKKYDVTASDIVRDEMLAKKWPNIKFRKAKIESLPFKSSSFDTVVCTHTLEHVLDLQKAISELRRVARKRIIIVVPKQRPYKYTFDLHIHFFPNPESLLTAMDYKKNAACKVVGGDLYYIEDKI
jgi:ubiquinone/menaquinone biosynthesis C-methylase UbiE